MIKEYVFDVDTARKMVGNFSPKKYGLPFKSLDVARALELFWKVSGQTNSKQLAALFVGSKRLKEPSLKNTDLFEKYAHFAPKEAEDHFERLFRNENFKMWYEEAFTPWKALKYFDKRIYCNLTKKEIESCKAQIDFLPVKKWGDVSEAFTQKLEEHPRYRQNWCRLELDMLKWLVVKTNDLKLLSKIFSRTPSSIKNRALPMIYEMTKYQIN